MSRKFKIYKNPYDEKNPLFIKEEISLEPNTITCLVGCNGTGKSTLIWNIQEDLKKSGAKEEREDIHERLAKAFETASGSKTKSKEIEDFYIDFNKKTEFTNDEMETFKLRAELAYSSTGEGIVSRLGKVLKHLGSFIHNPENKGKNLFIFFDDCDAGTSIDVILQIKSVFNLIANDCAEKGINYYIILTANSFEMCRDIDCVSVHTFEHIKFAEYNEFRKFVIESSGIKGKRYE